MTPTVTPTGPSGPHQRRVPALTARGWWGVALILAAVIVGVGAVAVTTQRPLSALEQTLFEVLIALLGLSGSYWVGQSSAKVPNARSAFRRLVSLYAGIGWAREVLAERQTSLQATADLAGGSVPFREAATALDVIEAGLRQYAQTIDDAIEDWRDLAPDEVAELVTRLEAQRIDAPRPHGGRQS
jgi:hypothetical protein